MAVVRLRLGTARKRSRCHKRNLLAQHADRAVIAKEKADSPMRPGIIIAIFAAVVVLIGGVIWYNNTQAENARVEQQQSEQAAQIAREDAAREEEITRRQKETDAAEQAARGAEQAEDLDEEDGAFAVDEAQIGDDDVMIVGDEITEGAIVVESATNEPTILDAENIASSAEVINDEETGTTLDSQEVPETDATAVVTTSTEPDQLLTPENFERDEVLVLIETTDQISDTERSTLTALVEGASANPAMLEDTIRSIRAALNLPALN